MYFPLNYEKINIGAGTYNPSPVKAYNNITFNYWYRWLFQRATSVFDFTLPEEWQGKTKDFFLYCLFKFGFLMITELPEYGMIFNPCTLSGYDLYYQPRRCLCQNPAFKKSLDLEIGKDCELLKMTPDYFGVVDIVAYYAEKLSTLDGAINMSLINNKFAFLLVAKNKPMAEALKKVMDKINAGEPTIITDRKVFNDKVDGEEPWQFLERPNLKQSYITTDQLADFNTILNNFDAEIGIPSLPYQKKERMVTSEAESRKIDSSAKSIVWYECLQSSIDNIHELYPGLQLDVKMRYSENIIEDGGIDNE